MHYDIFNGDADGIIALLQLRLADPIDSTLITGVKRDIQLVSQVNANADDILTILDISMAKNHAALLQVLESGATVFYADHHQSGEIPDYVNLDANIDLDANTCTALIIDALLGGQYHLWAITAAYGDNLIAKADDLATSAGLNETEREQLKELGTLINYNGYGSDISELHYHPAELFKLLKPYSSPFDVINDSHSPYHQLKRAYQQDIQQAFDSSAGGSPKANYQSESLRLYKLKDGVAARRVSGVLGNLLANQNPNSAHAVLTQNRDGTYTVSLRAPLNNKQGAGDVCSQFSTGGGRAAAGGINALPEDQVQYLIEAIEVKWGQTPN